jgi:lipid-A-disaccharide synthase
VTSVRSAEDAAREVLLVAGEASGDLHAAGVATALRVLRPDLALAGVGGRHMREAGVELVHDMTSMAVMGFVEVLKHVPAHYALLRRLRERLRSRRVALLVLVDYPGFNLRVAQEARAAGVPVLYFITPQVWAWKKSRLRAHGARDHARGGHPARSRSACSATTGIAATFVGHPLLDRARDLPSPTRPPRSSACRPDGPLLALFPGSRAQEIERHLEAFVATARLLEARVKGLRVAVSVAPTVRIDPARARTRCSTRARCACCAPRRRRCARAARRRSRRRWRGAPSSWPTARTRSRSPSRGASSRFRASGS